MLSKCKRFLSLLCAIVILIGTYGAYLIPMQSIVNAAENEILDLDEDVKYFGRTFYEYDVSGNKIYKFSWANSGFQFSFKGKGATITLQGYKYDSNSTVQDPYVKVYINGELATSHNISGVTLDQGRIKIQPNQDNIITVSNLKKGNYTVKVVKCTDGYHNGVSLSKIQLLDVDDIKGEILDTQKYYDRQLLFIGDSLLTGYGTLATAGTTTYSTAVEDSTLTFTALTADAFGAENMTIALRDRGIVSNRGGSSTSFKTAHLAKSYFEYLDFFEHFNKRSMQYNHTQYNPDVVVINLGLFDAISAVPAATFKTACKDFILQVKSAYPNAKILYTYGFMDTVTNANSLASTIEAVVSELNHNGYNDIFYIPLTACSDAEKGYKEGNYGFPTKEAHAARAEKLILAIEDITDWKSSKSVSVPVTDDMPADTLYRPLEDTDISVMSFNVMDQNSNGQIYLDPSKRAPLIAQMLKSYMPDIICLQEATEILTGAQKTTTLTIDGVTISWADYLTNQLKAVGYDYMWLTQTTNNDDAGHGAPNMNIGSGLIIFWKADRFVSNKQNSGRKIFVPTAFNNAPYQGRYWMWVQLQDKRNMETSFYVYNTHVYSYPQANSTQETDVKRMHTEMLAQLGSVMDDRANVPVFFAGDFVRYFNDSAAGQELYSLEKNHIKDASHAAPYARQSDPDATPNHIFFNSKYIDIRELHELYEGVEGRRLSSQEAIIAHFNFRGNVSFTGGTLSNDKSEFSDVSSGGTYALNVSIGNNVQADVYKDNGTAEYTNITGSQTLSLRLENKKVTHFTLRLKYGTGTGQTVNVVDIYITRTDVSVPTVSATNTVNSYFANGAYHLLAGNHVITVSSVGGDLYWNPHATRLMTYFTLDLKQGRTVLYVKSSATGDVYPVYIYRQTHTQALDGSVLYVDDDFPSSPTGKVAFYDGERVIFVDSSRAFATVEAAATAANGDGKLTTIYFGSGNYSLNQKYNGTIVKFTDDVILLGSNYDVSAVEEHADRWYAAGRKPESIIHGGFYFEKSGNISVTVKGFNFQGQTGYGAVRIVDPSASNPGEVMSHTHTLDIQNNIFMSSVDVSAAASNSDRGLIVADSQAAVTGIVKNNYFRCVQDNNQNNNKYSIVAVFVNLRDMLIERNFFLGYRITLDIVDVKESASLTSSTSYDVFSNRFEHCGSNMNRLFGVGANDKTHISYRNNDFIRCSGGRGFYSGASNPYVIDLFFDESTKGNLPGKVFENITIDIIGNRFMECSRSLRIKRAKLSNNAYNNLVTNKKFAYHDVTDMTVHFNKNAIVNPLEYRYDNDTFHSIWLTFFSKGDMKTDVSGTVDGEKWDFSGNYGYWTFFDENSNYYEKAHENILPALDAYGLYDIRKYMRNRATDTTRAAVTLTDSHFASKIHAYDKVAKAFDGAVGSFEDGWKYDFDHIPLPDTYDKSVEIGYEYDYISDIADMDFLRGTTPLSDKMTALDLLVKDDSVSYDEQKKLAYHSMLTTEHLTGEMRGQTSFYSDVRWYCRNRVSFDIRTTYTGDEATFFYKYSNGAMSSGDYATITNEQFYNDSETDVDGIILKFKTKNNEPTILMRVYKTDKTYTEIEFNTTNSAVTDMREFNHIDIIEKEIGTMDFYVNGKCFARVVGTSSGDYSFTNGAIANTTNSSNAYYNTVTVYKVEQNEFAENVPVEPPLATVSNASVTKQSAIAFSSAYTNASATANDLWPTKMSMEIDNLEIVDLGVGKLTIINDIAAGILYKAWNMTDCVYDDETKTYTYTINKGWIEFFTQKIDVNNSDLWESGTLGTNGENVNGRSDRLRTKTYISTDIEEITVAEGYQYIPVCYNPDGSFMGYYDVNTSALSGSTGKWTTETADVEAIRKQLGENVGIRLLFSKTDNSKLSLDLSQNLEFICFELREFFTQKIDVNNSDLWESGTLSGNGVNVNNRPDRLRTKTYISTDIEEITVAEGYQYIPVCYNPDGSFMGYYNVNTSALSGSTGIWTTETADVEAIRKQLGENVGIRLLFSKTDNSTLSLDLSQNLEFICFEPIEGTEDLISRLFRTTVLDDGRILLTFDRGGDSNPVEHDNEDMVQLAKVAVDYALEKGIQPVGIKKSVPKSDEPGKYEAVMPIDGPGYYLVNSTLGSLITTDTYDNKDGTFNLTVYEKNDPPMIDKYVMEDSDQNWKKFNDTSIGDEVQFKLLVTVQDGAYAYTIRDLYSEHFDNIAITSVKQYSSYDPASNSNPLVATFVNDTHYTVSDDKSNNVLTIKFASSDAADNTVGSLEEVPSGNVIEVIYTAKVLPSAPSEEAIQTSATLSYGRIDTDVNLDPDLRVTEQFVTEKTSVNTYLWSVNLFKYTEEEGVKKALSGAEFALCTDQAGSKKLSFIGSAGNYRVAASGEAGATTKLVDDGNGNYTINGLDSGIYYVLETHAPSGYTRLSSSEPINIAVQNQSVELVRTNTYTYDVNGDGTKDAFAFVNKAGFSLPSTGAAGRRMFIATGSVIVLSMSILLVTRMRSSKIVFTKSKVTFKKR